MTVAKMIGYSDLKKNQQEFLNSFYSFVMLGTIGAMIGGFVGGMQYDHLVWFVYVLQFGVLVEAIKAYDKNKIPLFFSAIYPFIFLIFTYQLIGIWQTGETVYPSIWWLVHGLNALLHFFLVRHIHNAK